MAKTIISSRHPSTIAWLARHYPDLVLDAEVAPHVTRKMVADGQTTVIGTLPIQVLHRAARYFDVAINRRPKAELLTADDLDAVGAELREYWTFDQSDLVQFVLLALEAVATMTPPAPNEVEQFATALAAIVHERRPPMAGVKAPKKTEDQDASEE